MAEAHPTVWLKDIASGEPREAVLCEHIQERHLTDVEEIWSPALRVLLGWAGRQEQSSHWDWRAKLRSVRGRRRLRSLAVECEGITQGLMIVDLSRRCRLESQHGERLAYVDYVEVAPWNRESWKPHRLFGSVGTALIRAAIQLSLDAGYLGRIGLHSLSRANNFYRHLGMTDMGLDAAYENLRYFEMTSLQAIRLQQDQVP